MDKPFNYAERGEMWGTAYGLILFYLQFLEKTNECE